MLANIVWPQQVILLIGVFEGQSLYCVRPHLPLGGVLWSLHRSSILRQPAPCDQAVDEMCQFMRADGLREEELDPSLVTRTPHMILAGDDHDLGIRQRQAWAHLDDQVEAALAVDIQVAQEDIVAPDVQQRPCISGACHAVYQVAMLTQHTREQTRQLGFIINDEDAVH